jgi:hypothetical protein
MEFDSVFLAWDFVGKNQAESKSNFAEGAQGRAEAEPLYQLLTVSHLQGHIEAQRASLRGKRRSGTHTNRFREIQ